MCFKIVYIILQMLLSRHVRLRTADNLSSRARLCAPHYAKSQQQQQRDRLVRSRESALLSRRAPKRKKDERESSITIGNKSKADATIARRTRRGGWPNSHPSQPPADNTTVFYKYKTIHEPPDAIVTLWRANFPIRSRFSATSSRLRDTNNSKHV